MINKHTPPNYPPLRRGIFRHKSGDLYFVHGVAKTATNDLDHPDRYDVSYSDADGNDFTREYSEFMTEGRFEHTVSSK